MQKREAARGLLMGLLVLAWVLAMFCMRGVGLYAMAARDLEGTERQISVATVAQVLPADAAQRYTDRSAWLSVQARRSGTPLITLAIGEKQARVYSDVPLRIGQGVRATYRVGRSGIVYPESVVALKEGI